MREENERRWAALKKLGDDEMQVVKEALKGERNKTKESLHKLDESISLLEKQLQEQKRQTDKIIAAEIKSRWVLVLLGPYSVVLPVVVLFLCLCQLKTMMMSRVRSLIEVLSVPT